MADRGRQAPRRATGGVRAGRHPLPGPAAADRPGRRRPVPDQRLRGAGMSSDHDSDSGIDPSAPPSGTGCVECDAAGGWWFHLRRCAACGHIGCCDDSPARHATAHYRDTGHPV
ncbi:zinc finger UBP-type domain containing protein, partial [Streptomyces sp. e14]